MVNNIQKLLHIDAVEKVLTALEIKFVSLFWDENKYGKKPQNYAVYYIRNEDDSLSSDDETEVEHVSIVISFYIKSKDFRNIKKSAKQEFIAAGFFVSTGYETYESDTGYYHFDLELDYFGG